ncbi:MAG: Dabb family protein [Sporolactobacillus sp.]
MIEHIVLFKFSEKTTEEEKAEGARRLCHLKEILPGILDIQAGKNFSDRNKGFSMALTVRLRSKADLENYAPSAEHQACVAYLKEVGLVDDINVDFEINE